MDCRVTTSSGSDRSENMEKLRKWVVVLSAYEHHNLDEELEKKSTAELLELLDEAYQPGSEDYNYKLHKKVIHLLSSRMEYGLTGILESEFKEHINRLTEAIIELSNRFENHRHKKEPNYSEKPVW